MSEAHTKGPWSVAIGNGDMVIGDRVEAIAVAIGENFGANAQLIAAAPDLLEALKYARRNVNASECDIAFIDAAIAKAQPADEGV